MLAGEKDMGIYLERFVTSSAEFPTGYDERP